jgi:uncharacterized DUF497 family protein
MSQRATVDAMKTPEQMFVWDEDKAAANERKHGITFKFAAEVFQDPLVVISQNIDHWDSEDRWTIVGTARNGVLVMVIFAVDEREEGGHVRIISARKATLPERREYESGEYSIREPEMTDGYDVKAASETRGDDGMKAEYDFSKGIRGKFAHWRLPICIDNAVLGYFHTRSIKFGIDTTEAINEILRAHVGLPPKPVDPPAAVPEAAERR